MKGFTLTQLLEQEPGSIPLTHRALRIIQRIVKARSFQHGVARLDSCQFADGTFWVVNYWVINKGGSMRHSFLHLRTLTKTGGLRKVLRPAVAA